jgi:hypothetical protein
MVRYGRSKDSQVSPRYGVAVVFDPPNRTSLPPSVPAQSRHVTHARAHVLPLMPARAVPAPGISESHLGRVLLPYTKEERPGSRSRHGMRGPPRRAHVGDVLPDRSVPFPRVLLVRKGGCRVSRPAEENETFSRGIVGERSCPLARPDVSDLCPATAVPRPRPDRAGEPVMPLTAPPSRTVTCRALSYVIVKR